MVNGNYIMYGDRPSSGSEIVDDHVQTRTAERKAKRKANRTANELQHTLNLAQLDNETDSVKYEKKIKEPKLLRYVPTTDVEENFVTEKFETYDLKPSVERPRRYAFTKKPKNPTDGSVNYAYSRSSSSCSSPNGNLPTISEHGEQYGTYRVHSGPSPAVTDMMSGYESKLEKYFTKPREVKKFAPKASYNGSHPDSLYRVPTSDGADAGKMARLLRVMRWPVALIVVCVALATFVYFLMPSNLESSLEILNSTYWETSAAGAGAHLFKAPERPGNKPPESKKDTEGVRPQKHGKTPEIDFYEADHGKKYDLISVIDKLTENHPDRKLPVPPVFPSHITPEVQYGNEKADTDKLRTPKLLGSSNVLTIDATLKPHITQKPERPLAIYFKDAITNNTESITRAETINDFLTYGDKYAEDEGHVPTPYKPIQQHVKPIEPDPGMPPEFREFQRHQSANYGGNFTSGHSKFFGIGIEDAEKMQSTTQSSLYNTRVSPTLPTWRDGDDTTTKKYPVVSTDVPQCHSPRLALCRGVLPYDLAGAPPLIGGVEITSLLPQIEYLVASNCSDRMKEFVCALLEPECNPPPYPPKLPCHNLCQAIVDSCNGFVPRELVPAFNCRQYMRNNCASARAPCHTREFQCGDGTCVLRDWMCDGTRDCPGGEDEASCVTCAKQEFLCQSGGCVPEQWTCDGYADCPKGEDEAETMCKGRGEPGEQRGEPGEEGAGSAPAPSVRKPNRLPGARQRTNLHKTGENDSSKELLITSDSSNALKRNFTRRPSPSRLTPYRPKLRTFSSTSTTTTTTTSATTIAQHEEDFSEEQTLKPTPRRKLPKTGLKDIPKPIEHNHEPDHRESDENIHIGDFFEEIEKEEKLNKAEKSEILEVAKEEKEQEGVVKEPYVDSVPGYLHKNEQMGRAPPPPPVPDPFKDVTSRAFPGRGPPARPSPQRVFPARPSPQRAPPARPSPQRAPPARPPLPDSPSPVVYAPAPTPPPTRLDKATNQFEKVIDGASMLRKAAEEAAAEARANINSSYDRYDDFPTSKGTGGGSSHSSPCPSGELRCVDGRCITLSQLCDGTIDCSDHADEDNCYT